MSKHSFNEGDFVRFCDLAVLPRRSRVDTGSYSSVFDTEFPNAKFWHCPSEFPGVLYSVQRFDDGAVPKQQP